MVEEKEISKMKFQVLVERLFKLKWLIVHDEFVNSECSKHREKFATFDKFVDAVDLILGEFLHCLWHHLCSLSCSKCYRKRVQRQ